jgi:hypothetical protein
VSASFDLFTLNFSKFTPDMGIPVRSSNGAPRWALKYDLTYSVPETFPKWSLVKAKPPFDVFREAYHTGLDQVGIDKLASKFRAIVAATGEPRLVLLCFEDIVKPGEWCHRRMFAEWWEKQTGEIVRELGPTGPPDEATLF